MATFKKKKKKKCWFKFKLFFIGDDGEPEHGATDIGLRLVACGVTAIFSLALLFFLIYRLRQRKMRDHAAAVDRVAEGIGSGPGDQVRICYTSFTPIENVNQSYKLLIKIFCSLYPRGSEASREVANVTEKKSAYPCIWCQRICLPICPSLFDSSPTHKTNGHFKKGSQVWLPEPFFKAFFTLFD